MEHHNDLVVTPSIDHSVIVGDFKDFSTMLLLALLGAWFVTAVCRHLGSQYSGSPVLVLAVPVYMVLAAVIYVGLINVWTGTRRRICARYLKSYQVTSLDTPSLQHPFNVLVRFVADQAGARMRSEIALCLILDTATRHGTAANTIIRHRRQYLGAQWQSWEVAAGAGEAVEHQVTLHIPDTEHVPPRPGGFFNNVESRRLYWNIVLKMHFPGIFITLEESYPLADFDPD